MKTAPHSKEAEMMVLGCMLSRADSFKYASENLNDSDFYCIEHQIIFSVLKNEHKEGRPNDVHLTCEELKRQDKLKSVGGPGYVTTLAQYASTSAAIEEYCQLLKDKTILRNLISTSQRTINNALEEPQHPQELLINLQANIKQIERHGNIKDKFPVQFLNEFNSNFLLVDPPKKPMLLEYANEDGLPIGFLPKEIVAMIVGAGGVGKTHLLAQLVIAVATGTLWLNQFTTTPYCGEGNKGNVFFGLGENQYDDIHRVLHKASANLRKNQPDLFKEDPLMEASKKIAAFSFCGQQAAFIENGKPSLYFRQLKMKLIDKAPENGWSLIILDPISRLMGADAETDNAAATQFIALMEELVIELPGNPTVLLSHHMNKLGVSGTDTDQTAARGSSALTDGVRLQINLEKVVERTEKEGGKTRTIYAKDKINMKMVKSNFTPISPEQVFQKDNSGVISNRINSPAVNTDLKKHDFNGNEIICKL